MADGIVTMDQAKSLRTPGLSFTNPRGMVGEVVSELSPRGKSQARFTCKCGVVHTREVSDWHHTLHCPTCMGKSGSKRAGAVASAAASLMAQDPELAELQRRVMEAKAAKVTAERAAKVTEMKARLEAELAALMAE